MWSGRRGGRSPAWRGVRRRVTWAAATAFIGWSAEARRRNIRFLAYNTRFLILPWVQVPHLASHILGRMARATVGGLGTRSTNIRSIFWKPSWIPTRFRGTCYRAANWIRLGQTTGRGKDDQTNRPNRSIKEVLGYPLTPTIS